MATFISFAQVMPKTAAVCQSDGQAGDDGESSSGETFLSALRTVLAGEENGGEKTQGTESDGESGEEDSGQKKKDEILCTMFLGQVLTMLPDRDEGGTQPVSVEGDPAGVVPIMGGGTEGNILTGMAEVSGGMRMLRDLPTAEASEPAAQNTREAVFSQLWSPKEEVSGQEAADSSPAQADVQAMTGEQSFGREIAPQISQVSDAVSGEEASATEPVFLETANAVSDVEAAATEPVFSETTGAGAKEGENRTEWEALSVEEVSVSNETSSVGQVDSGKAHVSDGRTDEKSGTDDEPKQRNAFGAAADGIRIGSAENAKASHQTAKADAASQSSETQEAYLQVSDRVMKEIKDGESSFVMKLHPEGMGEISVHLRNSADGVSIQMEASSEKTLQAIEQRSGELKAALEAHGVRVGELHLSAGETETSGFLNSFFMGGQDFGEHGASEPWHQSYSAAAVSDPEQRTGETVSGLTEYNDGRLNDKA